MNLYPAILLFPLVLVAFWSVVLAVTVMLFVVLVVVGVNAFGLNLSMFVTFAESAFPPFFPSHNLACTVPFCVNVWSDLLSHVFPSVLVFIL